MFTIAEWHQIREHQGQAGGDEENRTTQRTRIYLQEEDLSVLESSDPPPAASQSSGGSHMNDDMTSRQSTSQGLVNMGGSKFAFQQHKGAQAFENGICGQDSSGVGVMGRGYLGVGNENYIAKLTSSNNNSDGFAFGYPSFYRSF